MSTDLFTETGSSWVIQMLYRKNRSLEIKEQGLFVRKKKGCRTFLAKKEGHVTILLGVTPLCLVVGMCRN